jgi:penicillin-binding protein 1A
MRYYTDWIVDGLDEIVGTPTENLIIETTLDTTLQRTAEEALGRVIENHGEEKKLSQGAVVVMRPEGAIIAMVGGYDYAQSQFNRATQAKRQPGSSFKPIVYLTALENGWDRNTLMMDEPITTGRYRPQNFGGKYYGEVSLEEALTLSLNTISYQLIKDVGPPAVIDTAKRLGVYSPLANDLSLGLGSSSVSVLEMVTAYSTLANGGLAAYPYAITKITNENGDLYYQRPPNRTTRRVATSYAVSNLASMMQSVIQYGTGQGAMLPYPASGKTGTSQESRDAWFIGFTDELVAGVWLGNDDNSPMKAVTGGSYPASIWKEVMARGRGRYKPVSDSDLYNTDTGFQNLMGRLIPGMSSQQPAEETIRWEREQRYEQEEEYGYGSRNYVRPDDYGQQAREPRYND